MASTNWNPKQLFDLLLEVTGALWERREPHQRALQHNLHAARGLEGGKEEEEVEEEEEIGPAYKGIGWTLVGLYALIALCSTLFIVLSIIRRKLDKRPRVMQALFYCSQSCIVLFALVRMWDVLGELLVKNEEIDLSFGAVLPPIGVMLFITAFACVSIKGFWALFVWNPFIRNAITGFYVLLGILMWLFTIGCVIAFFAGFHWPKESEEEAPPKHHRMTRELQFTGNGGEADLLASDRPIQMMLEINFLTINACLVLLAISNMIILTASVIFVLRRAKIVKTKNKISRLVKLVIIYTLLTAFFLVRAIVTFIQNTSEDQLVDDYRRLILFYLVPDIVPTFVLFWLDWTNVKSLISSNGSSGSNGTGTEARSSQLHSARQSSPVSS